MINNEKRINANKALHFGELKKDITRLSYDNLSVFMHW